MRHKTRSVIYANTYEDAWGNAVVPVCGKQYGDWICTSIRIDEIPDMERQFSVLVDMDSVVPDWALTRVNQSQ